MKEVTPNAKKIEQHNLKLKRRREEKELRERQERVKRAQEANKRAAEERAQQEESGGGNGPEGDFMGKMGPEIFEAFSDPEVAAALQDVMSNPANIMKYQNNPKIMNLLTKIAGRTGGAGGGFPGFGGGAGGFPGFPGAGSFPQGGGGFPGAGFPGAEGFPGFPGSEPTTEDASKKKDYHDDGLD